MQWTDEQKRIIEDVFLILQQICAHYILYIKEDSLMTYIDSDGVLANFDD